MEQGSFGDEKFIPQQELSYPSIFLRPDILNVYLIEDKISKIKNISNELSPSFDISETSALLTEIDNTYEISYSINKEGFTKKDKITIRFDASESQGEQEEQDDNECSLSLHAHCTYLSDKENFDYDPATSIWVKHHRGSFLIETCHVPVMRLSTAQSKKEPIPVPSIQAVAQVTRQYQPTSEIDAAKRLDILYQRASFLTYIETPHSTDEYETVILEGSAYYIFNGIYENSDSAYHKYLSEFVFKSCDLSNIDKSVPQVKLYFNTALVDVSDENQIKLSKLIVNLEQLRDFLPKRLHSNLDILIMKLKGMSHKEVIEILKLNGKCESEHTNSVSRKCQSLNTYLQKHQKHFPKFPENYADYSRNPNDYLSALNV